jgi:hypothetical protein
MSTIWFKGPRPRRFSPRRRYARSLFFFFQFSFVDRRIDAHEDNYDPQYLVVDITVGAARLAGKIKSQEPRSNRMVGPRAMDGRRTPTHPNNVNVEEQDRSCGCTSSSRLWLLLSS